MFKTLMVVVIALKRKHLHAIKYDQSLQGKATPYYSYTLSIQSTTSAHSLFLDILLSQSYYICWYKHVTLCVLN